MNDKLYRSILFGITLLGVCSVIALIVYTWQLAQSCSIITYVANGG